jgi:hypothetical protein
MDNLRIYLFYLNSISEIDLKFRGFYTYLCCVIFKTLQNFAVNTQNSLNSYNRNHVQLLQGSSNHCQPFKKLVKSFISVKNVILEKFNRKQTKEK